MPLTLRAFVPTMMAAAMLALSGCQTAPTTTPPASTEGAVGGQAGPQSQAQTPLVEMFVARDQPGVGLTELQTPGKSFYISAAPSLTRADIIEALALADRDGQHFVGLRFTPDGARKLNDLSSQNVGSMMALFIDHELVASPRITGPLNRGVLAFGVPTAETAISIAGRIRGDLPSR